MMHANANRPMDISEYWSWTQRGQTDFSYISRESFLTPIHVGKNTYIKWVQPQKPITPPSPIPLHNKLFYWSGDNYLSHIIKHLEQIGGSNYRLPLGYPSLFIVLPLYITWWGLLSHAFLCTSLWHCAGIHWQRGIVVKCSQSKSFVIFF